MNTWNMDWICLMHASTTKWKWHKHPFKKANENTPAAVSFSGQHDEHTFSTWCSNCHWCCSLVEGPRSFVQVTLARTSTNQKVREGKNWSWRKRNLQQPIYCSLAWGSKMVAWVAWVALVMWSHPWKHSKTSKEKWWKRWVEVKGDGLESKKESSVTGNRTLVSRVTGGDTSHYTMTEMLADFILPCCQTR